MADLDQIYDVDHRADAIRDHQDGVLVCLAGPGTGKTRAFLQRAKALATNNRATPDEIGYLTFIKEISNAFAVDFEEEQELEVDKTQKPRISTLHSFACRLIRNQGFRHGFDGPLYFMSVADPDDLESKVFLSDLLPLVGKQKLTFPQLRKVLENVKEAWRDNTDPDALPQPVPLVLPLFRGLSRAYRLVDWDHTIPFAQTLFQTLDEPPEWIARLDHFLVDEYQDFNRAEQGFIASLATSVKSMVVVGDDNQSLFSGRGASPDGLRELYASSSVDRVSLVRCHRSKANILKAANAFLRAMRPDAQPMLPKNDGGEIICYGFKSAKAEIEYLAAFLKERIAALPEEPRPRDGIVCLFPTWKALNFYMERLVGLEVPCYSRRPLSHPIRAWLERALKLVFNPRQRFVERLILEDFSEIKRRHKNAMVELVRAEDISPVEAMDTLASGGKFPGAVKSAARAFCDLCEILSKRDFRLIPGKLAEHLDIDDAEIREHLDLLIQQLDEPDQEEAISSFCDALMPESAAPAEDPRAVLCLTMHGSKGLTKRTVVMPGLEEALLPGSAGDDELDQKRRLFYVALTRATDEVLITYPRTRARGDPFNYPAPGRGQRCPFVDQSGIRLAYGS